MSTTGAEANGNSGISVSREHIETFLRSGVTIMQSEEVRMKLKDPSLKRPGQVLIDIQRAQWIPLGINQDVGCAALDHIENLFPGNTDLLQLRTDFVRCAQTVYLQALQDRRPSTLECSAPMPRATIIEFFDACNTMMQTDVLHEKLVRHLRETGKMPNQLIIDAQRDMLEVLGFERNHGCNCLSRIQQDFPDDREMVARSEQWHHKAQAACMRAVQEHQASGGRLPQAPYVVSPELRDLQPKAKEALDQMTPEERGELIQKMQKKVMVFMNLPPEGRKRWCTNLSDEDKLEFVKGQMLLVSRMQQQWKLQQNNMEGPKAGSLDEPEAPSKAEEEEEEAAPQRSVEAVPAPQQMSMSGSRR